MAESIRHNSKETLEILMEITKGYVEKWWWNEKVYNMIKVKYKRYREPLVFMNKRHQLIKLERYKKVKQEANNVMTVVKSSTYEDF